MAARSRRLPPVDQLAMLSDQERAELLAIRAMRDVDKMSTFVADIAPQYANVPPHLAPLYELIDRSRHEQVYATVSMPPRSGKTVTFSLGVAYRAKYDPACRNYYVSHTMKRADRFGTATRSLVESLGVGIDSSTRSSDDWRTVYGGGLTSTSIGGQITGEGANGGIIIVDDIIKGSEFARSRQHRDAVWTYFRNDVMSRREGGASVIVINTRWHRDDIIGRIMDDPLGQGVVPGTKPWTHINLPAIHDGNFNAIDEREHPELATPL